MRRPKPTLALLVVGSQLLSTQGNHTYGEKRLHLHSTLLPIAVGDGRIDKGFENSRIG